MNNLQQMSRVLYRHDWTHIEDWADNVARLADLNDDEIALIARYGGSSIADVAADAAGRTPGIMRTGQPPAGSWGMRARQLWTTLAGGLRVTDRRAC